MFNLSLEPILFIIIPWLIATFFFLDMIISEIITDEYVSISAWKMFQFILMMMLAAAPIFNIMIGFYCAAGAAEIKISITRKLQKFLILIRDFMDKAVIVNLTKRKNK